MGTLTIAVEVKVLCSFVMIVTDVEGEVSVVLEYSSMVVVPDFPSTVVVLDCPSPVVVLEYPSTVMVLSSTVVV
jgi:hypothetical protein